MHSKRAGCLGWWHVPTAGTFITLFRPTAGTFITLFRGIIEGDLHYEQIKQAHHITGPIYYTACVGGATHTHMHTSTALRSPFTAQWAAMRTRPSPGPLN